MADNIKILQNLDRLQRIVDARGIPTQYFIRWLQNRGGALTDLDALITSLAGQVTELQQDVQALEGIELIAGDYLAGGGALGDGADITFSHQTSGVTPGSFTNADITVDEFGHITAAANGTGGGGGTPLGYWSKTDTGTGSSQNVTLPHSVSAENEILVFVNGIEYPVSSYSVSGTTLTLTTNASGDAIEVRGLTGGSGGGGGGGSDWIDVDLSGGFESPVSKWGRTGIVYELAGSPTFDFSGGGGVLQVELAAYKPTSSYIGFYLSSDGTRQNSLLKQPDGNTVVYYGLSSGNEGSAAFAWDNFNNNHYITLRATILSDPSAAVNIWQAQAGVKPSVGTGFLSAVADYPVRTSTMQIWIASTASTSNIKGLRYRIGDYPV